MVENRLLPQFEPYKGLEYKSAKGNHIQIVDTTSGKEYKLLDLNSGYWCCILGHINPEIMKIFESGYYANPFGFSNPHAKEYAEKLLKLTNHSSVVFSTSGSEAADIAIRLAWQSNADGNLCKKDKKYIISIERSYHGSTGIGLYVGGYSYDRHLPLVSENTSNHFSIKIPSPAKFKGDIQAFLEKRIRGLEERIAGIIFESVMGAAGGIPLPDNYLEAFANLSKKYGILLIADEVATGFGRTGKMFGYEHYGIQPDIICLGKGVTNGDFPFAVTLMNENVRQGIEHSQNKEVGKYTYGHTLSAHPTGCMIALKVLEIIERNGLISEVEQKGEYTMERLAPIKDLKAVRAIQGKGLFIGVELPSSSLAEIVQKEMMEREIFIKPEGRFIMVVPPYTITRGGIDYFAKNLEEVLKAL